MGNLTFASTNNNGEVKKKPWGNFSKRKTSNDKSIMDKTSYSRVKPELKKYCPEEWGRFLDNHYDPTIH